MSKTVNTVEEMLEIIIEQRKLEEELERTKEQLKMSEIRLKEINKMLIQTRLIALKYIYKLFNGHSRTSCSDENPINSRRGCERCFLINVINGEITADDLDLLEIHLKYKFKEDAN